MPVKNKTLNNLSQQEIQQLDAWWRASNYLGAGMIYLRDNVLLERPLEPGHSQP